MATAVRTMALGQNIHNILPNNCVIVQQKSVSGINHHGKRPIAPAIDRSQTMMTNHNNNNLSHSESLKCKKKFNYCAMPYAAPPPQTASVQRRNARERNRVKQVNNGFANLRQHIPSTIVTTLTSGGRGANKKLSKVDTLRMAVEYIRSLQQMLEENGENGSVQKSLSQMSTSSSYYNTMSCSDASSSSPTHSNESENSSSGTCYTQLGGFKHEPYDHYAEPATSPTPSYTSEISLGRNPTYVHPQPYKTDSYTYGELSPNPDDEELLDAITWWQQQ